MKHIFLLAALVCCSSVGLKAQIQSLRDHTWILGYFADGNPHVDSSIWGNMELKFKTSGLEIKSFYQGQGEAAAVANDEAGNFLFYMNGCTVFNNKGQVVENGDNLAYSDTDYYEEHCGTFKSSLTVKNGTLILPQPENTNLFKVFYLRYLELPYPSTIRKFDRLLTSTVDVTSNNGEGRVLSKDQIVIEDSLVDAVAAVRHANGRDWWVVIPRGINREFWKVLVTADGVNLPVLQSLTAGASPVLANSDSYGQAAFSSDGSKYCRINLKNLEIYDFDRCSGQLTFRRSFEVPLLLDHPEGEQWVYATGLAISPSSRFLYFHNAEHLFQFDMCEEHLEKGEYLLLADWDGYKDGGGFSTNFFQMRNGPDGKIYMNSGNTTHYLHVINYPNRSGQACDFVQRGLALPHWNAWAFNYFPNFNLYDVAGSICDTLGIDAPFQNVVNDSQGLSIYPNPAQEQFKLQMPMCANGLLRIYNTSGQLMLNYGTVDDGGNYTIPCAQWPNGVYIVTVHGCNVLAEKLVIAR